MKKKLITLLLAGVMVLSSAFTVMAEETPADASQETIVTDNVPADENADIALASEEEAGEPTAQADTTQYVEAADVLKVLGNDGYVILDVRADKRYDAGHLDGSIHLPLFTVDANDKNVVTDRTDALAQNFNAYVTENRSAFEGKHIYILCNGGASGADAATYLLEQLGITKNVYTIRGGANNNPSLQEKFVIDYNYVSGTEAVAAIGNENIVILDVRAKVRYDAGHLKGSISQPLFTVDANDKNVVTNMNDELSTAFTAFVTNNSTLAGKDIYLLCNGGRSGAAAGTKLLLAAGYSLDNIYTIENGAGNADVKPALTYVSADQALSVMGNSDYVIIDVRADERYNAGHLEGTVHLPLFTVDANDKNVPTTLTDDLANAFLNYVNANKSTLTEKTIYILCNSGATGAKNATTLLAQAGITGNVYTIEGGATNASIQAKFITDGQNAGNNNQGTTTPDNTNQGTTKPDNNKGTNNSSTTNKTSVPKTGDTSSVMPYILVMGAALVVLVLAGKKRITK